SKSHTRSIYLPVSPLIPKFAWSKPLALANFGIGTLAGKAELHRPHFGDVGKEMTQQILNAVAQRGGRRRAARAGALHVQIDDTVLETLERDVAAVIGDGRPYARLDQLLDRGDGLGIGGVEKLVGLIGLGARAVEQRRPRHKVLHDPAEDHGLEVLPLGRLVLGHCNEVRAEEYAP